MKGRNLRVFENMVLRRIFGPRRDKVTGNGGDCIMIVHLTQYCAGDKIEKNEMGWACMGAEGGCINSWWGNRRERDHCGDLGVDGWIILGRISRRWDVGTWTGLGWPRIEIGGGGL